MVNHIKVFIFLQHCLAILVFLHLHITLKIIFLNAMKKAVFLSDILLKLYINLEEISICTLLTLPIQENTSYYLCIL